MQKGDMVGAISCNNMTKSIKLAIASGKGGTGKTLVATNLFYLLQNRDCEVTLVDCDAEEPNAMLFFKGESINSIEVTQKNPVIESDKCTFCGKCQEYCSYNAIFILPSSKVINVFDDLCHGCGACWVACKEEAIGEKNVLLGSVNSFKTSEMGRIVEGRVRVGVLSSVPVIKKAIGEASNSDIVLFDSPPGTSCPFINTVSSADFVILVTEPTPFGLSDLKQSVETLKTMDKKCGVIINRAGIGNREIYSYLEKEQIPLLMEIPYDRGIATHYSNGELFVKHQKEWEERFMEMFNLIVESYGNSNN